MKILLKIFLTFFKIGAFTFGGAYAMLPLIQRETVERHRWVTEEDIMDIVAIAESTPGPIAINAATFVGQKVAGFSGAFAATFGVVLPSFLIILLVSGILEQFQSLKIIRYALLGIRAGVLALILKAFWGMFKKNRKGIFNYCIATLAFVLVALLKVNVVLVIALCGAIGLLSSVVAEKRKRT